VGGFAIYGILSNFPAVLAGAFLIASGLWTFVASIAVGAAYSLGILYYALTPPLIPDLGVPDFGPAISGIIAGVLIAWVRMAFRVKEKREPLLSALFSVNIFSEGGWQLFWRFLADVSVGYLVIVVFGMVGMVHNDVHTYTLTVQNVGEAFLAVGPGGAGGGFGGGGGFLSMFIFALAALFFAAILIGAIWGAGFGSVLGVGLWSQVMHGTAQGATVQLLLGFRKSEPKNFIRYVFLGAFSGAVEGALVGILCGCVVDWNYL
jgi:hypothetical protein